MPHSAKHVYWGALQLSLECLYATCAQLAHTTAPPLLPPLACSVLLANTPMTLVFQSAATAQLALTALVQLPFSARYVV